MNCPLQNIRLIQSISHQNQHINITTNKKGTIKKEDLNQLASTYHDSFHHDETTPFFIRYKENDKPNSSENQMINSIRKQVVKDEQGENELFKYLQNNQSDEQRGDYSSELQSLKEKLIQIQQISQKEISRLKQSLQQQKELSKQKKTILVQSIGVNTEDDHKDEQITILKSMLRQQCLLNKSLLKQSLRIKQNIYHTISITKN